MVILHSYVAVYQRVLIGIMLHFYAVSRDSAVVFTLPNCHEPISTNRPTLGLSTESVDSWKSRSIVPRCIDSFEIVQLGSRSYVAAAAQLRPNEAPHE